jgi:glyoxylase-like metal-dependent hydrolase (beta-lactamase superfamily II)
VSNPAFDRAGLVVFERGWLSSNNVLFPANATREAILVDSGYWTHAAQTVALVRRELGSRPLGRVINTHLHSDHCGGNHALQSAFDCSIDVPAGEAAKVDHWDEAALTYQATGQHCPRFRATGTLVVGRDVVCGDLAWKIIGSPGHDPESVVLYQPEHELLISADALWQDGFGVVFPELEGRQGFEDARRTLERLEQLRVRWVIPGHGAPFRDFKDALGRANRRLDRLIADPVRHANHAAKVLIKFHMLDVQTEALPVLTRWLATTPYLRLTHGVHFADVAFDVWCTGLLQDLCTSGALRMEGGMAHNL